MADSSVLADSSAYANALTSVGTLSKVIPTSNNQSANYVSVNAILIDILKNGGPFTSDELTLLDSIAALCPYVAGDAVYIARALYATADNTVFYDELEACTSEGERMYSAHHPAADSSAFTQEFVKVYPNPASDLLNLAYVAQTEGTVYFNIFDQLGSLVKQYSLPEGIIYNRFSLIGLSDGVYSWKLTDSKRTIQTGKVVLIR